MLLALSEQPIAKAHPTKLAPPPLPPCEIAEPFLSSKRSALPLPALQRLRPFDFSELQRRHQLRTGQQRTRAQCSGCKCPEKIRPTEKLLQPVYRQKSSRRALFRASERAAVAPDRESRG